MAVRAGLGGQCRAARAFKQDTHPMGLRSGFNLDKALQLAGANPLDIALASQRLRAANAELQRANVLWLPSVYFGVDYFRHDGRLQDVEGRILETNKSTFMVGATLRSAVAILLAAAVSARHAPVRDWPHSTRQTRPWTRWWWHGSAVDRSSLTAQLKALGAAGIGGVEITPIFGVRGVEDRFITYMSARWVDMLEHALAEAARLLEIPILVTEQYPKGLGPTVQEVQNVLGESRALSKTCFSACGSEELSRRLREIDRRDPRLRQSGVDVAERLGEEDQGVGIGERVGAGRGECEHGGEIDTQLLAGRRLVRRLDLGQLVHGLRRRPREGARDRLRIREEAERRSRHAVVHVHGRRRLIVGPARRLYHAALRWRPSRS